MNPAILFLLISASSEVYGRERDNRDQPDPPDTFRERSGKAWNQQNKGGHLEQQPMILAYRKVRPLDRQDEKDSERSGKAEMEKEKRDQMEQPMILDGKEATISEATTKPSEGRVTEATPSELPDRDHRRVGRQTGDEPETDPKNPNRMQLQIEEKIREKENKIERIEKDINETFLIWEEAKGEVVKNCNATEFLEKEIADLTLVISMARQSVMNLGDELSQAIIDKSKWSAERDKVVRRITFDTFEEWSDFIKKIPKLINKMADLEQNIENGKNGVGEDEMEKLKEDYKHLKNLQNLSTLIDGAERREQQTNVTKKEAEKQRDEAESRRGNVTAELATYSKELNVSQLAAEEARVKLTQMQSNCTSLEEERGRLKEQLREVIAENEKTTMPDTTTTPAIMPTTGSKEEDGNLKHVEKEESFVGSRNFWILFGILIFCAVAALIGGGICCLCKKKDKKSDVEIVSQDAS